MQNVFIPCCFIFSNWKGYSLRDSVSALHVICLNRGIMLRKEDEGWTTTSITSNVVVKKTASPRRQQHLCPPPVLWIAIYPRPPEMSGEKALPTGRSRHHPSALNGSLLEGCRAVRYLQHNIILCCKNHVHKTTMFAGQQHKKHNDMYALPRRLETAKKWEWEHIMHTWSIKHNNKQDNFSTISRAAYA